MTSRADEEQLARALYLEVDYPGSIKAHERALAAFGWAEIVHAILEPHGESRQRCLEAALEIGRRFADTELEVAALSQLGEDLVAAERVEVLVLGGGQDLSLRRHELEGSGCRACSQE